MKSNIIATLTIIACLLMPAAAGAYTASYYTNRSLLNSGHIVKVAVDTTGIYEISHEKLKELGFTDPTKVHVYGYGGVACTQNDLTAAYPDDLPQSASMHTADGRLIFFGEGVIRASLSTADNYTVERNYYDTKGYYFLSDSPLSVSLLTHPFNATAGANFNTLASGYCVDYRENDVQNPGNGSIFFHDRKLSAGEGTTYNFSMADYLSGTSAYFRYEGAALSNSQTRFAIEPSKNVSISSTSATQAGNTSRETALFRNLSGFARFTLPSTEKSSDVSFTVSVPSNFAGKYAALDKACLIYQRTNSLIGRKALFFNFRNAYSDQQFTIAGSDGTTEVWNITDPTNIFRYELSFEDEGIARGSLSSTSVRKITRLVAFNSSDRFAEPSEIEIIDNQNIHGLDNPDMIIVTTDSNYGYALELAEIHRQIQGLDVHVVRQSEAFNEFSSGACHPNAIRRLTKMFYDRDKTRLRYLLLYGQPTYDMRFIETDPDDYLVMFQVDTQNEAQESTTNYGSDYFFGMVADSYRHDYIYKMPTQISVGRIPANNPHEAADANYKIREYLSNPPSVREYLRGVFLSGTGDRDMHASQSNAAAAALRNVSEVFTPVHTDNIFYTKDINGRFPDVNKAIEIALKSGVGYFTYSGHAENTGLDGTEIWRYSHVNSLKYKTKPFAMLATCAAMMLDVFNMSIGEKMFFQRDGGMIGVLASNRKVYLEHNRTFNTYVASAYANATDGTTIGDLPRLARNEMISQGMLSALGNNSMSYNLCGDPAIPVYAPTHRVEIDEIAGVDVTDGDKAKVKALNAVRIKARITDIDGNDVENFNGEAIVDVFDTPVFRTISPDAAKPENNFTFRLDDNTIASVSVPVVNGVIDHTIVIGNPREEGEFNRMVITATENRGATAAGATLALAVTACDPDEAGVDANAPVIEQMYVGDSSFAEGDAVGRSTVFGAVVDPSASGLDIRSGEVGSRNSLILDGKVNLTRSMSAFSATENGLMSISIPLSDLTPGRHSIMLKVTNHLGLEHSRTINFNVKETTVGCTLNLRDADSPARTAAVLDLTSDEPDCRVSRLIIEDSRGNSVMTRSAMGFPFVWDLTDSNARKVPDGLYRAYVLTETPDGRGSSPKVDIVVVK